MIDPLMQPKATEEEQSLEQALRPHALGEFVG